MMRNIFLLIFVICLACSSNSGGVGSSIGNPTGTVPTNSLSPSFEEKIPEVSLGSELSRTPKASITSGDITGVRAATELWENIFLDGPIQHARRYRNDISSFLVSALSSLSDAGISTLSSTAQTATFSAEMINSGVVNWEVQALVDSSDDSYLRLNFRNTDTDQVQATYVLTTDTSGNVVKGLFVYVDPTKIVAEPAGGARLIAFAFDFSDSSNNLMLMRVDETNSANLMNQTLHIHYQCDGQNCLGEYLDTETENASLAFRTTLRYSWAESTKAVCLASIDYSAGGVLDVAEGFVGPESPEAGDITAGCSIDVPAWASHAYVVTDLPARFPDSDPDGGLAQTYLDALNGSSLVTTFSPTLIDSWVSATSF